MNRTFENALMIMQYVCNVAAQVDAYNTGKLHTANDWSGWSLEFCIGEIKHAFYGPEDSIGHFTAWDDKNYFNKDFWTKVFALPNKEKGLLGFRRWKKESDKMLIPLWIIRCLPPEFKLNATDIMGNPAVVCHDMSDQDVRGGCVAYMI